MATTTPLDASRVADIARQIRGAVTPVLGPHGDVVDAKDTLKAAIDAHIVSREGIIVSLAYLSVQGQWTAQEVKAAAAKAASMSNNASEKALATFIGETKRAMDPSVRSHVSTLISLRDQVWDTEVEMYQADKDTPTPLRKAFQRKYHLMIALFGATAEGRVFETCEDVLTYAGECDPDLDADKVHKRLMKLRDQLAAFYHDFPVDDIQSCVDTLNDVTKKALKASIPGNNVVTLPTQAAKRAEPVVEVTPDVVVEPHVPDFMDTFTDDILAPVAERAAA